MSILVRREPPAPLLRRCALPSSTTALRIARHLASRAFGCLEWVPNVQRSEIASDVVSGIVVGVMLLPQSLSYANVLEVPLTVGLNAGVVSGIAYALLGKIPFLSIGAAAESTAFLLTAIKSTGAQRELDIKMFAFLAGIVGVIASFLRGGTLIKILLNRPVGDGYSAAAATLVVVTLLKTAFNLPGKSVSTLHDAIEVLVTGFKEHSTINTLYSFLLFSVYAGYLFGVRFFPRIPTWIPHQLIVVIVSTLVTYLAELQLRIKLSIVKDLPPDLPAPVLPSISIDGSTIVNVCVLALICFLQNFTIASGGMPGVDADQEMWASGGVNFFCGLFGGFPVLGAFSRSGVLRDRGAKSPITHIVASLVMLATLAGLNRLKVFFYLPNHALAAIISVAMLKMIDFTVPMRLWRINKFDLFVWVVTFVLTLFTSITIGILTGMGVSLLLVILRIARPHTSEVGFAAGKGIFMSVRDDAEALVYPRVLLWRFDAPLYFVNLSYFEERLKETIRKEARPIDVIVIHCSRMLDIDAAGLSHLPLTVRNVELMNPKHPRKVLLAEVPMRIRRMLVHEGLGDVLTLRTAAPLDLHSLSDDAHRRVRLFATTTEAVQYARSAVADNVSNKDHLANAPRPAVAFLTDLLTAESTTLAEEDHEPMEMHLVAIPSSEASQLRKKIIKNSRFDPLQRELVGCVGVVRHADRTPKQKLKLQLVDQHLSDTARSCQGKLKLYAGSEHLAALQAALEAMLSSPSSENHVIATRMLLLLDEPPQGLTWQFKIVDDHGVHASEHQASHTSITTSTHGGSGVLIVAKWGGQLTDAGRTQAQRHGKRLVPRFFACGDLPRDRIDAFRSSVAVTAGNEERLLETAVEMTRALTGDLFFDDSKIRKDDVLLADVDEAVDAVVTSRSTLQTLLHCRSARKMIFHRHLPGVADLLSLDAVPMRCDPECGLTPCDVLWYAYDMLVELAGGAQNALNARRQGEAATVVHAARRGAPATLAVHETADEFLLRWAALAASFLPDCNGYAAANTHEPAASTSAETMEGRAHDPRWPFATNEPFDTSNIQKMADYLTFDMEHNLEALQALADSDGTSPEDDDRTSAWAASVVRALVKIDPIVRALSHVTGSLSYGMTSSERFVTGAIICRPLLDAIQHDVEAVARQDEQQGVRQALAVWLDEQHKHTDTKSTDWPSLDELLLDGPNETPTALLHLYFSPSSHVVGLQQCLLENPSVTGFHCSDEYQHQGLGYMTHLMFKVFRNVQSFREESILPNVDGADAVHTPANRDILKALLVAHHQTLEAAWRQQYRYSVQVFLSTGMHVVTAQQEVPEGGQERDDAALGHRRCSAQNLTAPANIGERVSTSVMSMVRIHDGLTLDDMTLLCSEATNVRDVYLSCA